MPELEVSHWVILIAAAFFGGLIDSIAGGGGLISVPAFLAVGFPPHLALGTNKLQASFGSLTAAFRYARKGLVDIKEMVWAIVSTAIGAATGTIVIQQISSDFLEHLILSLLTLIFFYTLFAKDLGAHAKPHRIGKPLFYLVFGLTLGFYDGFFGPGTGSLWTLALIVFLGLDMRKATGHTKVVNATSNVTSLIFFLVYGTVVIPVGIAMGIGQIAGAWIGSHMVLTRGVGFIRIFFLIVVAATILKMAYTTYF
ncbi:TSUP family transporter [Pelagicoccus sp. SDUM812002]|uniref:TSUP family transporter n=1 Tax=Pelagicoccus sp. SDUM812002 TaxID=3041266 RepID=UPI00280E4340|nr:TSUP family transporter [Pelagicoccus sp. SDUM812002]MDQ8184313.1 TSUP family transporter [Pelagicoccus sp. SDUM812002]